MFGVGCQSLLCRRPRWENVMRTTSAVARERKIWERARGRRKKAPPFTDYPCCRKESINLSNLPFFHPPVFSLSHMSKKKTSTAVRLCSVHFCWDEMTDHMWDREGQCRVKEIPTIILNFISYVHYITKSFFFLKSRLLVIYSKFTEQAS